MTRRAPGFARAFAGRWRITEMDEWDEIDLLGPAHITFSGNDSGELVFIAVEADLDVRYASRDGAACAEFSWEGFDDGSPASGRGWAALGTAGRLVGHIFRLAQAGQQAVTSPLAFARLVRLNLMHRRPLDRLLDRETPIPTNPAQMALQWNPS